MGLFLIRFYHWFDLESNVGFKNIQGIIKNKQDQGLIDQIAVQTDLIRTNKDKFNTESSNLNEILSSAELLELRYKEICIQLVDRYEVSSVQGAGWWVASTEGAFFLLQGGVTKADTQTHREL